MSLEIRGLMGGRFPLSGNLPPKRTIHRAARTAAFFVFATRTAAFAFAKAIDSPCHKGKNNHDHYDGGPVHAMTALAMR